MKIATLQNHDDLQPGLSRKPDSNSASSLLEHRMQLNLRHFSKLKSAVFQCA